jgi:hypothetical protein
MALVLLKMYVHHASLDGQEIAVKLLPVLVLHQMIKTYALAEVFVLPPMCAPHVLVDIMEVNVNHQCVLEGLQTHHLCAMVEEPVFPQTHVLVAREDMEDPNVSCRLVLENFPIQLLFAMEEVLVLPQIHVWIALPDGLVKTAKFQFALVLLQIPPQCVVAKVCVWDQINVLVIAVGVLEIVLLWFALTRNQMIQMYAVEMDSALLQISVDAIRDGMVQNVT